jgi:hypothetical protein
MNDTQFKKKNKPALCTLDPVMAVVPKAKFHELQNIVRQKLRDSGLDYDSGCPKRHTCLGNCTGRPIYHQVDELKPYIDKIRHLIAPDGMIYLKGCGTCPIKSTCKKTCNQVSDFMDRNKNKEDLVNKLEPAIVTTDFALSHWVGDDTESQPGILSELISRYGSIQDTIENLPWGAINDKRQRLIRMYVFEGKDFRASAIELGYSNGNVARNEFYRSLTTLSKFATVRYFIEQHRDEISDFDYELLQLRYYKFLSVNEISKLLILPVGTIRSKLFRFLKKSKTKYSRFVVKGKTVPSSIF